MGASEETEITETIENDIYTSTIEVTKNSTTVGMESTGVDFENTGVRVEIKIVGI